MKSSSTNQPLYGAVLLKAKAIMDFISQTEFPPTLKDISANVTISKPTVLKILNTLEYCGFVRREGSEKQYYLGTIFLEYADKVAKTFNIKKLAHPYLAKLRDNTHETVNLGIIEHSAITLLEKLESPQSVKLVSRIGGKMHMYSSAMGKAILANYSDKKLTTYLENVQLHALTPNTITEKEALRHNLEQVRSQGYAVENAENQLDIICVGFPLIKNNRVYGAFSVSAPNYRINQTKLQDFIDNGKSTQEEILQLL